MPMAPSITSKSPEKGICVGGSQDDSAVIGEVRNTSRQRLNGMSDMLNNLIEYDFIKLFSSGRIFFNCSFVTIEPSRFHDGTALRINFYS